MMLRIVSLLFLMLAVSPSPMRAQTPTPTPGAQQPQPSEQRPPVQERRMSMREVNVHVELTISDQIGTATPEKKIVSMLAADGTMGRIRTGAGSVAASLNVDARPRIQSNNRIVLELTVEFAPAVPESGGPRARPAMLNESLTVILEDGKPQVVSQAADPFMDRKMTVEVRATIRK